MPETTRQQKITFGEMRESGIDRLLIYCADFRWLRFRVWWPLYRWLRDRHRLRGWRGLLRLLGSMPLVLGKTRSA
jgi:hypothetical protein